MIPKLPKNNGMGKSFKGAALYYLHDKDALTNERVGMVETVNLCTQDPEKAWRIQAATAMNQAEIKAAAGTKATGRKLERPVMCWSLSWSPEEKPTPEHMMDTAKSSLMALGFVKHQALIVQHVDEPHPHVHLIVNRVCPETGIAHSPSHSKKMLSRWAMEYEREHGVQVEKRFENEQHRLAKQKERESQKQQGQDKSQPKPQNKEQTSKPETVSQEQEKEDSPRSKQPAKALQLPITEDYKRDQLAGLVQRQQSELLALEKQHQRGWKNVIREVLGFTSQAQESEKAALRDQHELQRRDLEVRLNREQAERQAALDKVFKQQQSYERQQAFEKAARDERITAMRQKLREQQREPANENTVETRQQLKPTEQAQPVDEVEMGKPLPRHQWAMRKLRDEAMQKAAAYKEHTGRDDWSKLSHRERLIFEMDQRSRDRGQDRDGPEMEM